MESATWKEGKKSASDQRDQMSKPYSDIKCINRPWFKCMVLPLIIPFFIYLVELSGALCTYGNGNFPLGYHYHPFTKNAQRIEVVTFHYLSTNSILILATQRSFNPTQVGTDYRSTWYVVYFNYRVSSAVQVQDARLLWWWNERKSGSCVTLFFALITCVLRKCRADALSYW